MAEHRITQKKKRQEIFPPVDYTLLFVVLFLVGFGLVMIYSASSYISFQENDGDTAYYFRRQLLAVGIGIVMMIVLTLLPQNIWKKLAVPAYLAAIISVGLVTTSLGKSSHGATRWLRVPVIGTVQPAEIAKICMILVLSVAVCRWGKEMRTWKGLFKMMVLTMPVVLEIYVLTNNLSSAIIVLGISALMIFVATPDYKKYILMGILGITAVTGYVYYIISSSEVGGFRGKRILAWQHPEAYAQDVGFQTLQALYAIGSGGIWGKGLGQSMQKLNFLPEAQNDMIFSIICEELGLFGAISVILMFIMLLWRMMLIASYAKDVFGSMVVVGTMGHIAIQVILNIAVVTNTIPNTGISLPFISYGGSSVVFLLMEVGMVLNVSRTMYARES